jgi:hypothetical protein
MRQPVSLRIVLALSVTSAVCVDPMIFTRNTPQMFDVAAGPVPTQVIHFVSRGDRTMEMLPDGSVEEFLETRCIFTGVPVEAKVSIRIQGVSDAHKASTLQLYESKGTSFAALPLRRDMRLTAHTF